jgi:chromosome segregation ATPase
MKLFRGKYHEDQGGTVATMAPETVATSVAYDLDGIQTQITALQDERLRLEAQSRRHSEQIVAIDAEAAGLNQKLVAGDATMGAALDVLDVRRVDSVRKVEGIKQVIANLEARLAPLARQARELAQIADQQRQDVEVAAFEKKAEQLSKEIIEGWQTACMRSYEMVSLIEEAIAGRGLDADHRSQVLSINEKLNNFFLKASLEPVNAGWVRKETHLTRRLNVQAARPR